MQEREPFAHPWERVPGELREYPQWVNWRRVGDRKVPVNPFTLGNAGIHWPNTWASFDQAKATAARYGLGLGFVLTADDPFVAIDLDHCLAQGEILPAAQVVVTQLHSYTEISPSGKGLHTLVACPGFGENGRRPQLEVYAHSRFLTVTGNHLMGTPASIEAVEAKQIWTLLPARSLSAVRAPLGQPEPTHLPDADGLALWREIFAHDRYGKQHRQRFAGDLSLDAGDHSLTVIRLLNCLARWTQGDVVQMRAMMLLSPLANEKWFTRRGTVDWLDYQIADAVRFTGHQGSGR